MHYIDTDGDRMKIPEWKLNRSGSKGTIHVKIRVSDLATLFGVTPKTIRRWRSSGKLKFTGNASKDMLMIISLYMEKKGVWPQG